MSLKCSTAYNSIHGVAFTYLVPVASAMNSEMRNESVGSASGLIPPTIHLENKRSAPTATMIALKKVKAKENVLSNLFQASRTNFVLQTYPDAQARVNTIKAGKMWPIPYKKLSTLSPMPKRK